MSGSTTVGPRRPVISPVSWGLSILAAVIVIEATLTMSAILSLRDRIASLTPSVVPTSPARSVELQDTVGLALPSVVGIRVGDRGGSAFAVDLPTPSNRGTALLTAAHVVAPAAAGRPVTIDVLTEGRALHAELGSIDRHHDLAVLFVEADLPTLPIRPLLDLPRPGETVIAIGSPYLLDGSVSVGVVSRVRPDTVQTDAAVDPGNSGGPLLDAQGRVIGVVSSAYAGTRGLSFAVSIDVACERLLHCDET